MSIAIKLNKYLNSFFKLNLKEADSQLYKSLSALFKSNLKKLFKYLFNFNAIDIIIFFLPFLDAYHPQI